MINSSNLILSVTNIITNFFLQEDSLRITRIDVQDKTLVTRRYSRRCASQEYPHGRSDRESEYLVVRINVANPIIHPEELIEEHCFNVPILSLSKCPEKVVIPVLESIRQNCMQKLMSLDESDYDSVVETFKKGNIS